MTIDDVEQGLGLLLAAGWTLDDVLDLSWDQLTVCIRCVFRVKSEQARIAIEALSVMLGGKPQKNNKKKPQNRKNQTGQNKDEQLMQALAAAGLEVQETKTPRT